MKTMNIEKQLQMDREVSSIEKLTVSEGLQYKKEEDGIRAIGPLYLIGSYSDAEGSPVMIRELIDMDVFAPAEKLSEEEFHIDIGEVQAQPQGHQIDVVIELQISGIKEEQEEGHAAMDMPQAQEEVITALARKGLPAGQAHLAHAHAAHDPHQAEHLLIAQHLLVRDALVPGIAVTIQTAQVAAVRQ